MKILIRTIFLVFLSTTVPAVHGYINITPAEVHARLVRGDTLLLLDVREISEYKAGHIAEPVGQLPFTPVNMPWNSNVLSREYDRLPTDVDMIVYCQAGGRSASASSFLDSKGFARIYNMTGGFSAWSYERRKNGFGDHSGQWVHASDTHPIIITCSTTEDTSKIIFPPKALPAIDSVYLELHFASSLLPIPPNVPMSDLEGLFRLTAFDRFGLPLFNGDSLTLADTVHLNLIPKYDDSPSSLINQNMKAFIPGTGWRAIPFYLDNFSFHRDEMILRRWYNVEGMVSTGISVRKRIEEPVIQVFPNPFNYSIQIIAPQPALIFIHDIQGRIINQLTSHTWSPDQSVASGVYFISINYNGQNMTKKVIYLK